MDPVGAAVETFGPFLLAAALFGLGAAGYLALVALSRWRSPDRRRR